MKLSQLFCIATAALALSTMAKADDTSEIKALYTKLTGAMKSTNYQASKTVLDSITTPDFTYYGAKGDKQSETQMLGELKMQIEMTKHVIACTFTPSGIKVMGNKATANATSFWQGRVMWMDKKEHTITSKSTSTNDIVKVGGKWKFSAVHTKTETMALDGKPMKM
jgi:hypothetical protein